MGRALLCVGLIAVICCGCVGSSGSAAAPASPLAPSGQFPTTTIGLRLPAGTRLDLQAYVAATPAARAQGLMGRERLPADTGMVFLFPEESDSGFWMKDTLIPLTIAFFDEQGRILRVLDMQPCEADPCTVYDPDVSYTGALEVPQRLADRLDLSERWRIRLPRDLPSAS